MTWINDINAKIRGLLQNNMYVTRPNGTLNATVEYGRSEGEGSASIQDKLPIVNYRIYDIILDLERIGQKQWLHEKIEETEDEITVRRYPVPYWIFWEFNITTEYQEDLMELTTQLMKTIPFRGSIYMLDDNQEEFSLFVEKVASEEAERVHAEKTKRDESKIRRFRSIFRYRLTAELESDEVKTFYKVKDIEIENSLKEADN